MTTEILIGDCIEQMRGLEAGSVHCCVTSPPYYGLRRYLFDNAVIRRYDLTEEEITYLEKELERRGIKPRQ